MKAFKVNIKSSLLLFIFVLVSIGTGLAQKTESLVIIGKVVNKNTKEDKKAVTITINKTVVGVSDINGTFEIKKTGDLLIVPGLRLKFSAPKMLDFFYTIQEGDVELFIEMEDIKEEDFDPTGDKLSTAGKKNMGINDIPASIVLIKADEIRMMGYQSVEEILKNVPGLYDVEDNSWTGGGPVFGVRGFLSTGHNNDMIIMVNGVNQVEDYWGFYPLSRLNVPVESIDRIEIIRGPMSVVYGSGAFFGAINIITNSGARLSEFRPDIDTIIGTVTANSGVEGSYRVTSSIKRLTKGSYYDFSVGIESRSGLNAPYSKMIEGYTGDQSIDDLLGDRRSFLSFSGKHQHFGLNINFSQADKGVFATDSAGVLSSTHAAKAHLLGGNGQISYAKYFIDSLLLFDARAGIAAHRNFQDYTASQSYYGIASFFSNAYEFEANGIWNLVKLLKREKQKEFKKKEIEIGLTTGVYYRNSFGLHTTYDIPDGSNANINSYIAIKDGTSKKNLGGFAQFFYNIKKLKLIGGVRAEYIPKYEIHKRIPNVELDTNSNPYQNVLVAPQTAIFGKGKAVFVPRGAAVWNVDKRNVVKLMYGEGIKAASFGQNSDLVSSGDADGLQPSDMITYEANYVYTHIYNADNRSYYSINASLFRNQLNNLINRSSTTNSAGTLLYASVNSGEITTNGIELGAKFDFIFNRKMQRDTTVSVRENLRRRIRGFTELNVTYQNSENKTPHYSDTTGAMALNSDVSFSPELLAYFKFGLDWKERFSFAIRSRFVDQMKSEFSTEIEDSAQFVTGYIADEVDSYFIHDLNCKYRVSIGSKKGKSLKTEGATQKKVDKNLEISLNIHNLFNKEYHYPVTLNNKWATLGFLGKERWVSFQLQYNF